MEEYEKTHGAEFTMQGKYEIGCYFWTKLLLRLLKVFRSYFSQFSPEIRLGVLFDGQGWRQQGRFLKKEGKFCRQSRCLAADWIDDTHGGSLIFPHAGPNNSIQKINEVNPNNRDDISVKQIKWYINTTFVYWMSIMHEPDNIQGLLERSLTTGKYVRSATNFAIKF